MPAMATGAPRRPATVCRRPRWSEDLGALRGIWRAGAAAEEGMHDVHPWHWPASGWPLAPSKFTRCSPRSSPPASLRRDGRRPSGAPLPSPACGRPAGRALRPGLPRSGMVKNTYGTGCFLLMTRETAPSPRATSDHDAGWRLSEKAPDTPTPRRERLVAGAVVQWLPRRPGAHPLGLGGRGPGPPACRTRGVVLCPPSPASALPLGRLCRGALLGITRGTPPPHRPRRPEGIRLSSGGRALRHGGGLTVPTAELAGGRRRRRQQPPDADPGD